MSFIIHKLLVLAKPCFLQIMA